MLVNYLEEALDAVSQDDFELAYEWLEDVEASTTAESYPYLMRMTRKAMWEVVRGVYVRADAYIKMALDAASNPNRYEPSQIDEKQDEIDSLVKDMEVSGKTKAEKASLAIRIEFMQMEKCRLAEVEHKKVFK